MSVRYSVVNCERVLPVVDNEDYDEDLMDLIEQKFPVPRGTTDKERTIAIRVCRNRTATDSADGWGNVSHSSDNERQNRSPVCEIRYLSAKRNKDMDELSQGGIPQDVLDQLDAEMSGNSVERQKRSHLLSEAYRRRPELPNEIPDLTFNITEVTEIIDEQLNLNVTNVESENRSQSDQPNKTSDAFGKLFPRDKNHIQHLKDLKEGSRVVSENQTDLKVRTRRETWTVNKEKLNEAGVKVEKVRSNNEVLEDSGSSGVKRDKMEESLDPLSYNYKNPKPFRANTDVEELPSGSSENQMYGRKSNTDDYDDYSDDGSILSGDHNDNNHFNMRTTMSRFRSYYIAAEEIMWDYGINRPAQIIKRR